MALAEGVLEYVCKCVATRLGLWCFGKFEDSHPGKYGASTAPLPSQLASEGNLGGTQGPPSTRGDRKQRQVFTTP